MSGTPGTADAVHISFRYIGQLIVDNVRKLVHINTSGCNICGYQHSCGVILEVRQRPLACVLRFVSMNSFRPDLTLIQYLRQFIRPMLGTGENQYRFYLRILQQMQQQVLLLFLLYEINTLLNSINSRRNRSHLYLLRISQHGICQLLYFRRHGSREKQSLSPGRNQFQYFFDIVYEAHIEHTVCLIQYKILQSLQ